MDVTVFGSANADLVFPVPGLPAPGHTVLGGAWRALPGGKGANQAVAAARDGARVRFFGAVGRDPLAEVALSALGEAGADLSGVVRVEDPTGAAAICVDPEGRNQIAVSPGANARAAAGSVPDAALVPGGVLLLQMEVPVAEVEAIVARAAARGVRVVLNLAPALPISREALRVLDLLVVNEHEAAWLAGQLACGASAAGLRAALGIDVAVTLGAEGVELEGRDGRLFQPAIPAPAVVDTTGAGDCWCGVMAASLARGLDRGAAMRRAAAAASISVSRAGAAASMPLAAETDGLLAGG